MVQLTGSLTELESVIRWGVHEDHPQLLTQYWQRIAQQAALMPPALQRQLYLRNYHTLMDTICDSNIAHHWRCICAEQLYRPLQALKPLAITKVARQQLQKLRYDMRTQVAYFLT